MVRVFLIFILFSTFAKAQDKLFFVNGTSQKGTIISMARDFVYFKTSDTTATQQIKKSDLLMIEDYKGARYVFSNQNNKVEIKETKVKKKDLKKNSLGIQPFGIFLGRATFVYERLSDDDKISLVVPFSLTFDPFGSIYKNLDTAKNSDTRIRGVNFITGLDVNFYVGRKDNSKFFVGPRFRYGTDLLLRNTEAYTLQTQVGWRLGFPTKKIVQHLSFGFGFVRILSSPAGTLISSKQSYGWYSINYRIGIKW